MASGGDNSTGGVEGSAVDSGGDTITGGGEADGPGACMG